MSKDEKPRLPALPSRGWQIWRTDNNVTTNVPGVTKFWKLRRNLWGNNLYIWGTESDFFSKSTFPRPQNYSRSDTYAPQFKTTGFVYQTVNSYAAPNWEGHRFYVLFIRGWNIVQSPTYIVNNNLLSVRWPTPPTSGWSWPTVEVYNNFDFRYGWFFVTERPMPEGYTYKEEAETKKYLVASGFLYQHGEPVNSVYLSPMSSYWQTPNAINASYWDMGGDLPLPTSTSWRLYRTQYNITANVPGSTKFYEIARGTWTSSNIYFDDEGNVPASTGWQIWRTNFDTKVNIPGSTYFYKITEGTWTAQSLYYDDESTQWNPSIKFIIWRTDYNITVNNPGKTQFKKIGEVPVASGITNYTFDDEGSDIPESEAWKIYRTNFTINTLIPGDTRFYHIASGLWTSNSMYYDDEEEQHVPSTGVKIWRTDYGVNTNTSGVTRFRKVKEGTWSSQWGVNYYWDDEGDEVPAIVGWRLYRTQYNITVNVPGVTPFYKITEGTWDEDEMYYDDEGNVPASTGWRLYRTDFGVNTNDPGVTKFYEVGRGTWSGQTATFDDTGYWDKAGTKWRLYRTNCNLNTTATLMPGVTRFYEIARGEWNGKTEDSFDDTGYKMESEGWKLWRTNLEVTDNWAGHTKFYLAARGPWSDLYFNDDNTGTIRWNSSSSTNYHIAMGWINVNEGSRTSVPTYCAYRYMFVDANDKIINAYFATTVVRENNSVQVVQFSCSEILTIKSIMFFRSINYTEGDGVNPYKLDYYWLVTFPYKTTNPIYTFWEDGSFPTTTSEIKISL